ncbi:hypothetical protein LTR08_008652 [Meristemomyces frigidus]|nr:hypothetical protein LTR08_008652 [Meristemomyces frigidus]
MATPAIARRSEPYSSSELATTAVTFTADRTIADKAVDTYLHLSDTVLHADIPVANSLAHETASRASTPRPSISPLSTASKPNKSPITTRDMAVAESDAVEDFEVYDAHGIADAEVGLERDDRSSSLSDPEDDQDEEGTQNGGGGAIAGKSLPSAQRLLDVDSEAETERLEQTPQKLRKHADSIGRTPSKLNQAATMDDELSDPPSPLPIRAGAASSTSTIGTAGKKRKRSQSADSSLTSAASDLAESPRKRSHESPVEPEAQQEEEDTTMNGIVVPAVEEGVEDTTVQEELQDIPLHAAIKGSKGKKGKQKTRKKEAGAELMSEHLEVAEVEVEPSEETAAKKEEQQKQKTAATSVFEDVAKQFTAFRERQNNERIATLTAELNLLSQPDSEHPEYLQQVACINARRDKQIRKAHAYYHYRSTATRQRTLGDRSQLQSQYFQQVRELRDEVLEALGKDWNDIQSERRQQHQEEDEAYIYKFPAKKSAQIRQQAKYNQEVSVLGGIAKYVGFPAAPDIKGAEGERMEDDFKSMKIAKRVQQPTVHRQVSQQILYPSIPTVSAQNERLAHEQFIEQNAWAQPQRPIHTHGTPNLTHTPDWAEPGPHSSARNVIRNISGQIPVGGSANRSPFMTPMPQKQRAPVEHSSSGTVAVGSDGVEMPSSVLAAPPTADRMHFVQQQGVGSGQVSPLMVNKYRQNGTELTGYRNMSGMSGASTIDAPLGSAEKGAGGREQYQLQTGNKSLPALLSEISAPRQMFDAGQMHRHGEERREKYPGAGYRLREGVFGTPAPMQSTANLPP